MKKLFISVLAVFMLFGLSACDDREADKVSYNVSKEADNFNVIRRYIYVTFNFYRRSHRFYGRRYIRCSICSKNVRR